jgi:hypothetical protein
MLPYELSRETRIALAPYVREFQAAVQEVANREMGVHNFRPIGINKNQGGVTVNVRPIAIFGDAVMDDWKRDVTSPTREERAVVNAIKTVVEAFNQDGAAALAPYRREDAYYLEPLNAMICDFVE